MPVKLPGGYQRIGCNQPPSVRIHRARFTCKAWNGFVSVGKSATDLLPRKCVHARMAEPTVSASWPMVAADDAARGSGGPGGLGTARTGSCRIGNANGAPSPRQPVHFRFPQRRAVATGHLRHEADGARRGAGTVPANRHQRARPVHLREAAAAGHVDAQGRAGALDDAQPQRPQPERCLRAERSLPGTDAAIAPTATDHPAYGWWWLGCRRRKRFLPSC